MNNIAMKTHEEHDCWSPIREVEYYNEHYLQEVRHMPSERTPDECAGIERLLCLQPTQTIIDLCSGEGRLALELARRGYDVLGVDNSLRSIQAAQYAAQRLMLPVKFIVADARSSGGYVPCDRIYCASASLNGFIWQDAALVIQNIAVALRPGGKLLLEVANRDRLIHDFQARTWRQIGDKFVSLIERSFDHESNEYVDSRIRYFPSGECEHSQIRIYIYPQEQLHALLSAHGLKILSIFGEYSGAPLTERSTCVIFIAERLGQA